VIRALTAGDRGWVTRFARERWGSELVVADGRVHHLAELAGFADLDGERVIGLVTYLIEGERCEVISLDAVEQGRGVGSELLECAVSAAREAGCRRLELITTNDNLRAIRFYQRRGLRLVAVHPGAVEHSRRLKPEIPLIGDHGIPLRDELLFARDL
jgi:ribosomal protein S18 acetylase RimI-like enzyme